MIPAIETGQLIVYVTDDSIDDAALASAVDMIGGDAILIDASQVRNCGELEGVIAAEAARSTLQQAGNRSIVISNLLEVFYDTSIFTREAARILGRVKSMLETLSAGGTQIAVLCQRRSADLGTRSHFMASLCASADHVYFRRSTYTAPPPPSQRRAEV